MKIPQKAIDHIGPVLAKACEAVATGLRQLAAKVQTFATEHPEATQHAADLAGYREAEKAIETEIGSIEHRMATERDALAHAKHRRRVVRDIIDAMENPGVPPREAN